MRRLGAPLLGIVLAVVSGPPAALAGPTTQGTFQVANSASFDPPKIATGALITIFTSTRVGPETGNAFNPWVTTTPAGVRVEASCADTEVYQTLPISWLGNWGEGSQINAYLPNSIGPEPYGACALTGGATFVVWPAPGWATPMAQNVPTIDTHPGIFMAPASAPAGQLVTGSSGVDWLHVCNTTVPANPEVCRSQTNGVPARLVVSLTGAEYFVCTSCDDRRLWFELAPVTKSGLGAWVPLVTQSFVRSAMGIEEARLVLPANLPSGEYRLRVRNSRHPEMPVPLTVWLGRPT